MAIKLALGAVVFGAVAYTLYTIKQKVDGVTSSIGDFVDGVMDYVPSVVKEGAEATGTLTGLAFNAVTSPLDTFGIEPDLSYLGVPNWTKTAPWNNSDDVVSNGSGGMNFNYF